MRTWSCFDVCLGSPTTGYLSIPRNRPFPSSSNSFCSSVYNDHGPSLNRSGRWSARKSSDNCKTKCALLVLYIFLEWKPRRNWEQFIFLFNFRRPIPSLYIKINTVLSYKWTLQRFLFFFCSSLFPYKAHLERRDVQLPLDSFTYFINTGKRGRFIVKTNSIIK